MSLNMLFVFIILGGWMFGKAFSYIKLPNILGMTLWGIGLSYFFKDSFPSVIWELAPFLKSMALIIILLRAGLGIQKEVLQKVGFASVKMAIIPCLFEGLTVMVICRYFLLFSWVEAGMMGFILAAVSPAVVVPSMLTLKSEGYGKQNETPTLILSAASLDDIMAISFFTIFLTLYQSGNVNYWVSLMGVPYAILVGLVIGSGAGFFLSWFFKKHFRVIRASEKIILLLGLSIFMVQVGSVLHMASLLGIMIMGFILLERSPLVAKELSQKLSKIWIFAEIFLFVLIGMAVDVSVALKAGLVGVSIIFIGIFFRSFGVFVALWKTKFDLNERVFCAVAYVPKATVQAALGAVPLLYGVKEGEMILSVAVLSICLTAPLGLLSIRYYAPKLLKLELGESED
jgi:solute carrier family 9B (sodium/hydrogen exchanger), member 1/2